MYKTQVCLPRAALLETQVCLPRAALLKTLIAAIALALSSSALALSNSFSYQGSLTDAGTPANGSYDLQFQLQTSAGANLGAALVREDVSVASGVFSVELDFGAAITSADFRLQIGVRPGASVGAFTTLAPTTPIRPTPQAQVAGIASEAVTVSPNSITSASIQDSAITANDIEDSTIGNVDVDTSEIQLRVSGTCFSGTAIRTIAPNGTVTCENVGSSGAGTVTSVASGAGLTGGPITSSGTIAIATGGVTSAMIADASIGSADINSTQVQARVSGACIVGSAVRAINADGTVSCESDDIGWSLGGNLGTNPATNYIGTFDAQPFVIRTQNARSLRIEPSAEQFSGSPITTNIIAGSSANNVTTGVRGATIAGGGLPSGDSDPFFFGEAPNRVTDIYGTVGGGFNNIAGNDSGTTTDAHLATVAGGARNRASNLWATVGGGDLNVASGGASVVAGGFNNTAAGQTSAVLGGASNCAGGLDSVAMGRRAKVRVASGLTAEQIGAGCMGVDSSADGNGDEGSFVWADSNPSDFVSSGPQQFLVRAGGGVMINTSTLWNANDDVVIKARNGGDADVNLTLLSASSRVGRILMDDSSGSFLFQAQNVIPGEPRLIFAGPGGSATLSNGGTWTNASSRSYKTGFAAVDTLDVLARVVNLPISTWNYIDSAEGLHMGPIAEDFKASFGLAGNGMSIATVDADGVALAAIQGLNQKLETDNAALRAEIDALRQLVLATVKPKPTNSD